MLQSTTFRAAISAGVLLSLSLLPTTGFAQQTNLIDFVVLNDGVEIEARDAYENALAPIAARYGAEVAHSYDIVAHLAGPMEGAIRVNVWDLDDPNALAKVDGDPDYQALVPERDRIHDLERLTLYAGEEIVNDGPIQEGFVLVDLVVMKDGKGEAERDAYEARMAPLAARYGYEIAASYRLTGKIAGEGPETAMRLILWNGDSSDGLQQLTADADYQALENERQANFDFSQLTLFLATPTEE